MSEVVVQYKGSIKMQSVKCFCLPTCLSEQTIFESKHNKLHVSFVLDANVPSPFMFGYPNSPFGCNVWPSTEYIMSPPAPSPMYSEADGQQLNTPVAPNSPHFPVFSVPPSTPIIYTGTDVPDLILQSPLPMYSPTVEMQYITPPPYMYPATPPPAWYPPGVNSQGFIFPTPPNIPNRLSGM